MKKVIVLVLLVSLILSGSLILAEDKANIINNIDISKIQTFEDVQNHWSKPYVTKLLATNIISGYSDGTFKPQGITTRGEFLRMLVSALHEDVGIASKGHWAKNYERVAIENKYLLKEFDDLNKAITREEIAVLISRAMNEVPDNLEDMKKVFSDYPEDIEIANHIAKIAGLGIIIGDNGKYRPQDNATRAETSTILIRILDPRERKIPEIIKEEKPVDNKDGFIEPVFGVMHYTEVAEKTGQYGYDFIIIIENHEEYGYENRDYQIKTECINVPELNIVDMGVWGDSRAYQRRNKDGWRTFEGGAWREKEQIWVWEFSSSFYTTIENAHTLDIYEGMELDFKITLKKGDIEKVYYHTVILEEKTGRGLHWKQFSPQELKNLKRY